MQKNKPGLWEILNVLFCLGFVALLVFAGAEVRARARDESSVRAVYVAVKSLQFPAKKTVENSEAGGASWEDLQARWPDLWGFLDWPGYASLPVMQGQDNQFYLSHSPDGEKSAAGTPFLDYRQTAESKVWLVYGHNMKSREAFSLLPQLRQKEIAMAALPLTLTTAEEEAEYTLFAVCTVDTEEPEAWDFGTDAADRELFLQGARSHAELWLTEPQNDAQILALSTCCDFGKNGRLVLLLQKLQKS